MTFLSLIINELVEIHQFFVSNYQTNFLPSKDLITQFICTQYFLHVLIRVDLYHGVSELCRWGRN